MISYPHRTSRLKGFLSPQRLRLYFIGLLFLQLALFYRAVPYVLDGAMDYRTFYTAGFMSRTSATPQLYDYETEARLQNAVVTPSENALPFMSPAYTALLFYPLTWARYRLSYLLFAVLNLSLLALSFFTLRPWLLPLATLWKPLPSLLFITFLPVGVALIQGQVSIILLALACVSYAALQGNKPLFSGLLLSFALIKFQVILPVALLFLLWRRWRFVTGFTIGATCLAAISTRLTGSRVQSEYLHSLFSMSSNLATADYQIRYGIYPSRMPNLYGLAHTLIQPSRWGIIATIAVSASLFVWSAFQKPSFPRALLVGLAISFHLYLHDLSLLLLPISLMLAARAAELHSHNLPAAHGILNWKRDCSLYAALCLLLAPLGRILIATDLIGLLAILVVFLAITIDKVGEAPPPLKTA